MIRNYFIITLRNFFRNGNYTFINVAGLSIGVTCCIILFLMIRYDLGFERFHSNLDSIYIIGRDVKTASGVEHSSITPYPLPRAFRNDFPEIPLMTQLHDQGKTLVTIEGEKFQFDHVLFADSLFLRVLDFKVISGNPSRDLGEPGKVFVTRSFADKYLHGEAKGHLKLANLADVEVVGMIADPPATSQIQFSMIVSRPTLSKEILGFEQEQWGLNSAGMSFIVLPSGVNAAEVERRFEPFVAKYYKDETSNKQTYRLLPLRDFHFNKEYNEAAVDKQSLWMLGILAAFIVTIACINFVNLATALAVKKSKEIGIRKTLGANRTQLTFYFLGETFLITLLAMLLSLGVVEWMLPWLNSFLDKQLADSLFTNATLLLFISVLTLMITLLSGLYPSLILSGYEPVMVLKNRITTAASGSVSVRKVLVAFQFLIAQALIIGTLIVSDQMSYIHSAPLGFQRDAVINVTMPQNKPELQETFRTRLMSNPDIEMVSYSLGAPISQAGMGTTFRLDTQPDDESYEVTLKTGDEKYLETYGLELIAGRGITEADAKLAGPPLDWDERKYVFVVNETAVKQLGFNSPEQILNKNIKVGLNDIVAPVVGVVKDFHVSSMRSAIQPVVILNFPYFYYDAGIKVKSSNLPAIISFIENTWNDLNPDYFFECEFLDDYLQSLYLQEERTFTLFKIFSGIAIFIGCLGLYGLISFMANQKLKEVGIRKVLGASVGGIVMLFSREFVKLIAIAFIVAAPLSWYVMNEWLQRFAYNTGIHFWVFIAGLIATLIIALGTVSWRSIQAALTNPVETLRSE